MKEWERIRDERCDVTDYVIHLTRSEVRTRDGKHVVAHGLTVLMEILDSGVLTPSYAPRTTRYQNRNLTIRGPHPDVCFTDQPLSQILVTVRATHLRVTALHSTKSTCIATVGDP